jgi:hypothetical protein
MLQVFSVLLKALATLIGARSSHVHLRSPKAGASDLNDVTPFGSAAISEVIINYLEAAD